MSQWTLTQADHDRPLAAQPGDRILVRLDETPGTGYRWVVDEITPQVLTLESSDFLHPAAGGVGGGGERIFTVRVAQPGEARLQLKLWRDWEGERSVLKRFAVTLRV